MALLLHEAAIDGAYVDLQRVRKVLSEQRLPAAFYGMGKSENEGRLNGRQITLLARNLLSKTMKQIAKKYLNISHETIQNICYENKDHWEACNRNLIRYWARKNPGVDQIKVSSFVLGQCSHQM